MMPPKQYRHCFPRLVPRFPVGVLAMVLLTLVVLEGYNMIHETNPEVTVISDTKA
jgi:hypothetical protein